MLKATRFFFHPSFLLSSHYLSPLVLFSNLFIEFELDSILYINCVCAKSFSSIWLCVTLWTGTRQVPLSNSGVDSHALLQGIFPTQGSLISKHMLWKLMKYEYVLGGKLSILWYLSNTLHSGSTREKKKNPQVLQAKCGWNTRRVREASNSQTWGDSAF